MELEKELEHVTVLNRELVS